jgi:hypothetical protein
MKKILYFSLFLTILSGIAFSENLIDIYKKGKVRLVPVAEFASGNNWNEIFPRPGDPYANPYRNLAVAPDESIFVAAYTFLKDPDKALKCIYKFGADGRFRKKFGEKGRRTRDGKSIYGRPEFPSVLDGKYVVVGEYDRIRLYDLDGNEVKVMKMTRPVYGCEALKDGQIALVLMVFLLDGSVKQLIVLKNVETEKESVIAESISNEAKSRISFKDKSDRMISFSHQFSGTRGFVRRTPEGSLLTGFWRQPSLSVFDKEGRELKEIPLNIKPFAIDEKIKSEFYDSAGKALKKFDLPPASLKEIEQSKSFFPQYMPFYYNFLVDSGGNIVVFQYPVEGTVSIFRVYSPSGDFICESQFDAGDYEISFKPSAKRAVFHDGFLYAVAEKKGGSEVRLMKFKLEAAK